MKQVLSVTAIENGTVIDHIPAGRAVKIIEILNLLEHQKKITVGINLPSKSMGLKDLIKIEDRFISEEELSQIAIFAPHAHVNIIENYQVAKKFALSLPETTEKHLRCPNPKCITNAEPPSSFAVFRNGSKVVLQCRYCEKGFSYDAH